jgi:hypothetical protein
LTVPSHCWGIGLGRTGTHTFCEALRLLGYDRVKYNPQFDELRDLNGGADNGVTIFYKYLDYKFPGSRFVLTMRDLDSWLESIQYINNRNSPVNREDDTIIMRRMTMYETVTFDREKYTSAYHRHHADVERYFEGRDDLLRMNIMEGDGWDKLCPFLGIELPVAAFPHLHKRI